MIRLAIAAASALLLAASPGLAASQDNGIRPNGIRPNGIRPNGVEAQGQAAAPSGPSVPAALEEGQPGLPLGLTLPSGLMLSPGR